MKIKNNTSKGYLEAAHGDGIDLRYPTSNTRRGRVQKGLSQTLCADSEMGVCLRGGQMERIRKLTPRESWRLQGFSDEAFDKAQSVCSDTQLYKQAGNSITIDVLVAIFGKLFADMEKEQI